MSPVRSPAVAGMFYPGERDALSGAVDRYLADAQPQPLTRVRAIIAPHAGYIYSGPTAGYAFRALQDNLPSAKTTVYLLGPAHRSWFSGVSTGDFDFDTPLGIALTDRQAVRELWELDTHYQALPDAHRGEHCLEVQLPFLQRSVHQFDLVPLLFGEVDACAVGRELAGRLCNEPDARVVVSSDLSHFHDYETAGQMDRAFLQSVLDGNRPAVERNTQGACGRGPIAALMGIASQLGWQPHLLDYRNSGDTAGDKWRVVGYAAVAYTEA